jgi:putative membrane protein
MDATTKQIVRALALVINGLFAYVMLEMVMRDRLKHYLNTDIFGWVVTAAAILLGGMVLLRAAVWAAARAGVIKDVAHDCCGHDHGHDHSHEQHSHTHEVSLWRLIVVSFPLMLLMAGLVPTRLSAQSLANRMSDQQRMAAGMAIESLPAGRNIKDAKFMTATMVELVQASRDPSLREMWESSEKPRAAIVKGQLMRTSYPNRYQLHREKMTCCAQDAVPVMILVAGNPDKSWPHNEWLEVSGPVSFQKDPTGGFTAVLHQVTAEKIEPPADIYLK